MSRIATWWKQLMASEVLWWIGATVLLGLIFVVISAGIPSSSDLSLLVGLSILAISLIAAIGQTLLGVRKDIRERLTLAQSAVTLALDLKHHQNSGKLPIDHLRTVVDSYLDIDDEDVFFANRIRVLLRECAEKIQTCREGHLEIHPDNTYDHTQECMQCAERTVFATSYIDIPRFWTKGPGGPEYFQANLEAIGRGVKITRVFILAKRAALDGKVREIITNQLGKGMTILVAYKDDLPASCWKDMAIFDKRYVEYLDVPTQGARITRNPGELQTACKIRDQILSNARNPNDVLSQAPRRPGGRPRPRQKQ
jgi:hypothetical protein